MAPHPLPSPRCRPCSIPCADVLSSGGTAALRYEMQAAQIAACVTPAETDISRSTRATGANTTSEQLHSPAGARREKNYKNPPVTNGCEVQIGFW